MTLDPEDLNPTDRAILDELRDGRVTPAHVAEEHGYSSGNVRNRMTMLASHDHVRALGGGLYELVDDPRDDSATDDVDETAADAIARQHELEVRVEKLEAERDQLRADLEACREGVDIERLADAADAVERGLDRLPNDVPGRTPLEDARAILRETIGDE